jgi:hypothetical protein
MDDEDWKLETIVCQDGTSTAIYDNPEMDVESSFPCENRDQEDIKIDNSSFNGFGDGNISDMKATSPVVVDSISAFAAFKAKKGKLSGIAIPAAQRSLCYKCGYPGHAEWDCESTAQINCLNCECQSFSSAHLRRTC